MISVDQLGYSFLEVDYKNCNDFIYSTLHRIWILHLVSLTSFYTINYILKYWKLFINALCFIFL